MNKPFLRILKLAYKLHKAGASTDSTQRFIDMAKGVPVDELPSASEPVADIVAQVYNNVEYHLDAYHDTLCQLAEELGLSVEGAQ